MNQVATLLSLLTVLPLSTNAIAANVVSDGIFVAENVAHAEKISISNSVFGTENGRNSRSPQLPFPSGSLLELENVNLQPWVSDRSPENRHNPVQRLSELRGSGRRESPPQNASTS